MTEPVDVVRLRADLLNRDLYPPVVGAALLEVLERLAGSVQALHDRLDTLERAWRARGSL